jgi:hypothetical protein
MILDQLRGGDRHVAKRCRTEEVIDKLREANILISKGKKVTKAVSALGIIKVTYNSWRNKDKNHVNEKSWDFEEGKICAFEDSSPDFKSILLQGKSLL